MAILAAAVFCPPAAAQAGEGGGAKVLRRVFSRNASGVTVGLANLHAVVPDVQANRDKVLESLKVFKSMGVNLAVFPEFALSGYFWDDEAACWPYMRRAALKNQLEWLRREVAPLLDSTLRYVVLNVLRETEEGGKFYNSILVLAKNRQWAAPGADYRKVFIPGIEKTYTVSGEDDRLVLDTEWGRFGFATCYDACFFQPFQEYGLREKVDGMIITASWRGPAERSYPGVGVRTETYYADLWEMVLPSIAAMNQVWVLACNAVGTHAVSGDEFAGRSAVYAPSGIRLVQASGRNEELVVVENLLIGRELDRERGDFNYVEDFFRVYRPTGRGCYTRRPKQP
jgi:predicted amidohydrolase